MLKLLIFLIAYACATPIEPKAVPQDYRLPEGAVTVSKYDIELRIEDNFFEENKFGGTVSIWFTNLQATNEIKLHANGITFSETKLFQITDTEANPGETGVVLKEENFLSDKDTDVLTVVSTTQLEANGNYRLNFVYSAQLRTSEMYGFYKSYYIGTDGQKKFLGTTQFQPTSARKAFPCFDEPEYKATFDIKIRRPKELLPLALGNTEGTDVDDNNFVITTFKTTPIMSTYLIAFIVSDFDCTPSPGNTIHSVCSRKEAATERALAVDFGPKLITVMEEITGIKYLDSEIGKMHQVAIPDFSAGAMENWGLLTYRETGLLYDPAESSNSYKQSIQNVISHEIAHMWFGNLVTCKWWSNTFLNEGFARLYQYFATSEVETTWELDKQFVTAQVQPMLVNDAAPSAAALSQEAYTQAQVSSRFGSVSYNKGGSIFRMLQHVIGKTNFNQGLNRYLTDNKFGATVPEDLWNGIEPSIPVNILPEGTNLSKVMDSWINRAGFPLLHVEYTDGTITIKQKRYVLSGTPDPNDVWYVPIAYTLSTDVDKFENMSARAWLLPDTPLAIEAVLEDSDWIILNNQQIGYYRVQYDDDLLNRIETLLKSDNFGGVHELNRAHLVDDIYNLAKIDVYKYERVFQLFDFLKSETSYYTWNSALTAFSNMLSRTGDERIREALSEHILDLLQSVYESVPFDEPKNDEQIYTFNRVQAITWACRLNQEDCKNKAVAAFNTYVETKEKPDKNLKSVIYCNGLRHSTDIQAHWDFLWGEYSTTKLATEQATILSALGCAKDPDVLNEFLTKSITEDSGIRQQDASSVFSTVYTQNPEGVDIAYAFLISNWRAISEYYGSMNALNNLFSGLAARFNKEEQVQKLRDFLANPEGDLPETVLTAATAALGSAEANLIQTAEFEKQLTEFFKLDSESSTDSSSDSTTESSSDPSTDSSSDSTTESSSEPTADPSSDPTADPSSDPTSDPSDSTSDDISDPGPTDAPDGSASLTIGMTSVVSTLLVLCYQFLF